MMRAILIITALITVTEMAPTPTNMTTVIAAIEEATNINHYCRLHAEDPRCQAELEQGDEGDKPSTVDNQESPWAPLGRLVKTFLPVIIGPFMPFVNLHL